MSKELRKGDYSSGKAVLSFPGKVRLIKIIDAHFSLQMPDVSNTSKGQIYFFRFFWTMIYSKDLKISSFQFFALILLQLERV